MLAQKWHELRYDYNLDLDSKYYRRYEKGELKITKINDNGEDVNIDYDFNYKPKNFDKFLHILEDRNIVTNYNKDAIV